MRKNTTKTRTIGEITWECSEAEGQLENSNREN